MYATEAVTLCGGGCDLDGGHKGKVGDGAVPRREVDEVTARGHLAGDRLELVVRAATLCDGNCNPVRQRLQPYVMEAATLCNGGCNLPGDRLEVVARGVHEAVAGAARIAAARLQYPHRVGLGHLHRRWQRLPAQAFKLVAQSRARHMGSRALVHTAGAHGWCTRLLHTAGAHGWCTRLLQRALCDLRVLDHMLEAQLWMSFHSRP